MTKALVVLSGGQDSTTCLFWAVQMLGKENVSTVTFNYGQRHVAELRAAKMVSALAGIHLQDREFVMLGEILKSTSPLTNHNEKLEQYADFESMDKIIGDRVEKTFVPMRNSLFLTLAANRAVASGCNVIFTGVCQEDNANYPDCRESFIAAQSLAINESLGLTGDNRMVILTPLIHLSKRASIILALGTPGAYSALAYSHTAYDGQFPPVGNDHASTLRAHGFEEAGVPDPLVLRAWKAKLMQLPKTRNYNEEPVQKALEHVHRELHDHMLFQKDFVRWWTL